MDAPRRRYEVQKTQRWSRQSSTRGAASLVEALAIGEAWDEEGDPPDWRGVPGLGGYIVRIREYELSGYPGLRPIRPDRYLTLDEARAEVDAS